jgi:hypothetical protein
MRRIVAFGEAWLEDGGWSRKAIRTGSASVPWMSIAWYVEVMVMAVRQSLRFQVLRELERRKF